MWDASCLNSARMQDQIFSFRTLLLAEQQRQHKLVRFPTLSEQTDITGPNFNPLSLNGCDAVFDDTVVLSR